MAQRTAAMRAIFDASATHSPLSIPTPQTALLLLDYQNFIIGRVPDEPTRARILVAAAATRAWAKSQGIHVYHCCIDLSQPPIPSAKLNFRWPTMKGMLEQQPDADGVAAPLAPTEGEKVMTRRLGLLSALSSPELIEDLKLNDIKSLFCCGISTSAVVLSTARHANELGYHVTVVKDACFDPSVTVHEAMVDDVLPIAAHVANLEEVVEAWKARVQT